MKYLFLDDERCPGDVTWIVLADAPWTVVRSYDEAVEWVLNNGYPDVISFDHDLGLGKDGFQFAKWLVEYDMDTDTMPYEFEFTVHSKNPIGATNIFKLLTGYIEHKK